MHVGVRTPLAASHAISHARHVPVLSGLNADPRWSASSPDKRVAPSIPSQTLSLFHEFLFSKVHFDEAGQPLSRKPDRQRGRSPPLTL
jgi:hypothetical protein